VRKNRSGWEQNLKKNIAWIILLEYLDVLFSDSVGRDQNPVSKAMRMEEH
jgi:hypothetical protein